MCHKLRKSVGEVLAQAGVPARAARVGGALLQPWDLSPKNRNAESFGQWLRSRLRELFQSSRSSVGWNWKPRVAATLGWN